MMAALAIAAAVAGGCAGFDQGYRDGLERKAAEDYGWGHELYEVPIGVAVIPILVVLAPLIGLLPHGEHALGYLLGETWAGDRILLDPGTNYGG